MSRINLQRKSCKDVFHTSLVCNAAYGGIFEFPQIEPEKDIPNRLIVFSKAMQSKDYDQWVHFYEDDYKFERIWRNPQRYLERLKNFNGVILPDFSLYRDMPLVMQLWNIYRSRAIGHWLQMNGVKVIPNIRYGDKRTYQACCDGIEVGSVIAVGSYGVLKNKDDRVIFENGLEAVVKIINPTAIVVYGSAPYSIFGKYENMGIRIVSFESEYAISHREVV